MYLSHLLINAGDNPDRPNWKIARRWLRSPYRVHQRLCMAFPSAERAASDPSFLKPFAPGDFGQVHVRRGSGGGFLFRVDALPGGSAAILVLSATEPCWDYAFHNAAHLLAAPPQVRQFSLDLNEGQRLRFRLRVNPVKSRPPAPGPDGRRGRGKRKGVMGEAAQRDWLAERLRKAGAELTDCQIVFESMRGIRKRPEDRAAIQLLSILAEGHLVVKDAVKLRSAVMQGIGPAKAFGFGLLSLAKAE
ncbi:MAG: type I-E CRISPR-associated protein Cas6/Cse3/CasE [Candidatus Sumerlaeia bacterium]|nr:type I-E CRISPR-associated protein Cas6/Cse3/CasE [Candidatus Sumerlaeia bacterium]